MLLARIGANKALLNLLFCDGEVLKTFNEHIGEVAVKSVSNAAAFSG